MATTIGTAYVKILPTTDGITGNLTSALSDATETAGKSSGSAFGSSFGRGLIGTVGTIATASAAAIGSVVSSVNSVAQAGDVIDKTSQKIGVSAEQYQALAFAAEHSGFEVSTFQIAAKSLENTDFSGSVYDALEAIQSIQDPAERSAMAIELFGARSAQQMAPLINGAQTIGEFRNQLDSLGGLMSNESVSNAAAFEDAMTDMKTALTGMKNSLVADFMPAMTDVMNGFAALLSGNRDGLAQMQNGISSFMDNMLDMTPQLVETVGQLAMTLTRGLIENLPKIIEVGMNVVVELCNGIVENLPTMVPTLVDVVLAITNGLINNAPLLINGATGLIVGLANGLIKALPQLISQAPQIISALVGALVQSVPQLAAAGWQLIQGLANGIISSLTAVVDAVTSVARSIVQAVKNFFGIHSPSRVFRDEIGQNIMLGLAEGFEENEDVVGDAIGDVERMVKGADLSMTGSYSVGGNDLASVVAKLSDKIDALAENRFDFYLDGKQITDCVTLRQRRTVRAAGV